MCEGAAVGCEQMMRRAYRVFNWGVQVPPRRVFHVQELLVKPDQDDTGKDLDRCDLETALIILW